MSDVDPVVAGVGDVLDCDLDDEQHEHDNHDVLDTDLVPDVGDAATSDDGHKNLAVAGVNVDDLNHKKVL